MVDWTVIGCFMYVWIMWKWSAVFDCATIIFGIFFCDFTFPLAECWSLVAIFKIYLQVRSFVQLHWTSHRNVFSEAGIENSMNNLIWSDFERVWTKCLAISNPKTWDLNTVLVTLITRIGVHNSCWEFGYGTSRSKNWIQKVQLFGLRYWSMLAQSNQEYSALDSVLLMTR